MTSWSFWKKKRVFFYIPLILLTVYCLLYFISMYKVLNILSEYTYFYIYKKTLYTSYTFTYTFLIVSKIVESRQCILKDTNILLNDIKKHYFILIINQSQPIKTIYFQIYFIYIPSNGGWLGPIFGISHDLLTHNNHWITWHLEYMTLYPHSFY